MKLKEPCAFVYTHNNQASYLYQNQKVS